MGVYVVCPSFVAEASEVPEFLLEVLYVFCLDNDHRLAVDRPRSCLFALYIQAAEDKDAGAVAEWIRFLGKVAHRAIERVDYSGNVRSPTSFAVGLAKRLKGESTFVAWSEQDYMPEKFAETKIAFVDRFGARAMMKHNGEERKEDKAMAGEVIGMAIAGATALLFVLHEMLVRASARAAVAKPAG